MAVSTERLFRPFNKLHRNRTSRELTCSPRAAPSVLLVPPPVSTQCSDRGAQAPRVTCVQRNQQKVGWGACDAVLLHGHGRPKVSTLREEGSCCSATAQPSSRGLAACREVPQVVRNGARWLGHGDFRGVVNAQGHL